MVIIDGNKSATLNRSIISTQALEALEASGFNVG